MISKRCWLLKDMGQFMAVILFPIIRVQWKIWNMVALKLFVAFEPGSYSIPLLVDQFFA